MSDDLEGVLRKLLRAHTEGTTVDLDSFAAAFDGMSVSNDEIDLVLTRFEAAGGVVVCPEGGLGTERLKVVLGTAREMSRELGRTPSPADIATRSGLHVAFVRQALALGRAMGR